MAAVRVAFLLIHVLFTTQGPGMATHSIRDSNTLLDTNPSLKRQVIAIK
jgi:hypothetical protein